MAKATLPCELSPSSDPDSAIDDAPQLNEVPVSCIGHDPYVSEPLMLAGLSQS